MTLNEFKAWFEGFSEIMDGPPNADQWKRVQARVAEISGTPVSYPVFIDRYVTPYRRWYVGNPYWGGSLVSDCVSIGSSSGFNPLDELKRAGRAEYLSVSQ